MLNVPRCCCPHPGSGFDMVDARVDIISFVDLPYAWLLFALLLPVGLGLAIGSLQENMRGRRSDGLHIGLVALPCVSSIHVHGSLVVLVRCVASVYCFGTRTSPRVWAQMDVDKPIYIWYCVFVVRVLSFALANNST